MSGSTFTQYGGNYATQNLFIGGSPDGTSGTGAYAIVMGSMMVYNNAYVGYNGAGAFNQGYDPSTARPATEAIPSLSRATFTWAAGESGRRELRSGTGTYNLYNGTLSVTGNTYVGYNGTGIFNQTGGTHQRQPFRRRQLRRVQGTGTYNFSGGIDHGRPPEHGRVKMTGGASPRRIPSPPW